MRVTPPTLFRAPLLQRMLTAGFQRLTEQRGDA
jgi:hypothetical protein